MTTKNIELKQTADFDFVSGLKQKSCLCGQDFCYYS